MALHQEHGDAQIDNIQIAERPGWQAAVQVYSQMICRFERERLPANLTDKGQAFPNADSQNNDTRTERVKLSVQPFTLHFNDSAIGLYQ
jgi:hypothetical protein